MSCCSTLQGEKCPGCARRRGGWLFGQNGAVTLLGLGQFSRSVMGDGGLELGGKIGGGGPGHDGNQSRWPAVRDDAGAR